MSSHTVPQPPFQAPAPEPEANPHDELRQRRAMALASTVRPVPGGFRVSSACHQIDYLVTQPNGRLVCTCPDYAHHEEEDGFRCKHVLTVEIAHQQGLVNGHGQPSPAPTSGADLAVIHRHLSGEDPVRIKLIKHTEGYSWEVAVAEVNPDAALARLQTNIPLRVRFPYGDCREITGQYGLQFMYTVEVDGLRARLYATPGLHHKLQEAGMGAGAVFTVTKIETVLEVNSRLQRRRSSSSYSRRCSTASAPPIGRGRSLDWRCPTPLRMCGRSGLRCSWSVRAGASCPRWWRSRYPSE